MERSESTTAHDDVAIIVDAEINNDELRTLFDKLYAFLSKDEYFRMSHYRILRWFGDELTLISKSRVDFGHTKHYFEDIEVNSNIRADWNVFWQLYKPHKRAGQVIMITTADKVEAMRDSKAIAIKYLLIIYQSRQDTKVKELIKSIPCIAYIQKEEKIGDNDEE